MQPLLSVYFEYPMEEPQQKQRGNNPVADDHRVHRRRNPQAYRPRRRNPLFRRCLLIRNLPKGFVGWSDLTDQNTPIRVRRIVYCEESHGSIMVEFMSEAECNTILTLDQQRKRKIRQRIQQEQQADDETNHNFQKLYAFEIMVTVEGCSSERFVRSVLMGGSNNNNNIGSPSKNKAESSEFLNGGFADSATLTSMPPPSPLPSSSSSSLAKRCIVIRKLSNPHNVEEDLEIPEAPAYERKVRADDGSLRSEQPQIRPPSPMEIRSGNLSELVVRAVTLRNKSNMMPAMVVELESEESVERILQQEQSRRRIPNSQPATLAIPVEIHAVKSERYANICFANTRKSNDRNVRSNNAISNGRVNEENETLGSVDEESQMTADMSESKDIEQNGHVYTDGELTANDEMQTEQIKNLEKEIRNLKSEMGRWKALATKSNESSDKKVESDSSGPNTAEENPHKQELVEEKLKNVALGLHVKELIAESKRLREAEATKMTTENYTIIPESSTEEEQKQQKLLAENEELKAQLAEMEELESELEESRARQKTAEKARKKLEEENSGLLRYVYELKGHRNDKVIADEERHKELEKKHADLLTLYRFTKAQAEKSTKEIRNSIAEIDIIKAELRAFKMAWKNRIESQRRLEQNKINEENYVCLECETVKFCTVLEEHTEEESDGTDADSKAPMNGHSNSESDSASVTAKAPASNGIS